MSDMPERIYAELEEQSKQLIELLDKAQWLLCDIANDGNNLDGSTFMYSALLGDDEWMIKSNEWCSEKAAALASMEKDDERVCIKCKQPVIFPRGQRADLCDYCASMEKDDE